MSVIISGQKKTSFPMSLALMLCKSAPDHEVHNYFSLAPHPHFNATFKVTELSSFFIVAINNKDGDRLFESKEMLPFPCKATQEQKQLLCYLLSYLINCFSVKLSGRLTSHI